jgi:hypothetical protein
VADDLVQAFLWKHLVPASELVVGGRGRRTGLRRGLAFEPAGVVRLAKGGTARVSLRVPEHPVLDRVHLELSEPPDGVTLESVERAPGSLTLVLKASEGCPAPGYADNLIVAVYVDQMVEPGKKKAKGGSKPAGTAEEPAGKQKRRVHVGCLPALPIEMAAPAAK